MRRDLIASLVATALVAAGVRAVSPDAAGRGADGDPLAPQKLSETGLYVPGQPDVVAPLNRPFSPQYPLWSDGAEKSRWAFLPEAVTIDATDADEWNLPVGTRLWKEFRLHGRKVETRMLWKARATRWIAASYVWNAEGTDATLAPEAGLPAAAELEPGRWHAIPSAADCHACHGTTRVRPLGFTALQLSTDRDPNAIHGEPLTSEMITLKTLVEEKRLSPASEALLADPPRIRARDPLTRSVLGYLATNCGSCHDGGGAIAVDVSLRARDVMHDGDLAVGQLVEHRTKWPIPGAPDGTSVLVRPQLPDQSALLVRMRSRRPSSQMPPLATSVRDQAAVDAVTRWIATLSR